MKTCDKEFSASIVSDKSHTSTKYFPQPFLWISKSCLLRFMRIHTSLRLVEYSLTFGADDNLASTKCFFRHLNDLQEVLDKGLGLIDSTLEQFSQQPSAHQRWLL